MCVSAPWTATVPDNKTFICDPWNSPRTPAQQVEDSPNVTGVHRSPHLLLGRNHLCIPYFKLLFTFPSAEWLVPLTDNRQRKGATSASAAIFPVQDDAPDLPLSPLFKTPLQTDPRPHTFQLSAWLHRIPGLRRWYTQSNKHHSAHCRNANYRSVMCWKKDRTVKKCDSLEPHIRGLTDSERIAWGGKTPAC